MPIYNPSASTTTLPHDSLIDTSNRTKAGTTYAAITGLAGLTLEDLTVGQEVELLASGFFGQSGASGSTSGKLGFLVDQPTSGDVNLKSAICASSDAGGLPHFSATFTVTEAGTHVFYIAGESGNASNVEANGATVPTRFSAKAIS